jgi:hypothetical protein
VPDPAAPAPPAPADPAAPLPTGGTPAAPPVIDPAPYCATADRFTADLTTPPALTLAPPSLRARRPGRIELTLSKVSVVSLRVLRDGAVVLARSARLGRGAHAFAITPRVAGPLEVRLHATDLAGNAADAAAVTQVRRARRSARN